MHRLASLFLAIHFCGFTLFGQVQEQRPAEKLDGLMRNFRIGALSTFTPGDANGDGAVTVADVFYLINSLFAGGAAAVPMSTVTWKGAWSSTTTYDLHDAVSQNGSSWVSRVASNTNNPPETSPAQWDLLAQRGSQGLQGPAGGTGPTGPQGPTGPAGLGIDRQPHLVTTVSAVDVVDFAMTIGSDGLGLIAFREQTTLKIAHCSNIPCTAATVTTIDSSTEQGISIAIGSDGLGLISYSGTALKIAHCSNVTCTAATIATLATGAQGSSLTIGSDGMPLVAYALSGGVWVDHCSDTACSGLRSSARIDDGNFPSVTIVSDGQGLISYIGTGGEVKVAHCANLDCSPATIATIDIPSSLPFGQFSHNSITTGSDGLGILTYVAEDGTGPRVAHCADVACASPSTKKIIDDTGGGFGVSITVGADGLAVLSYVTGGRLRFAHCSNVACTSATLSTLNTDNVDEVTSVTIGADGLPLVGYVRDGLKVVHLSNPLGIPHYRRR